MTLTHAAWNGAEGFRREIGVLVVLSALAGLLESAMLLLLFHFVGRLIPGAAPAVAPVASSLSAALAEVPSIAVGATVLAVATFKFGLGLVLEWRMSSLWVTIRRRMQCRMLSLHLNAGQQFLLGQKTGAHAYHIIEGPAFAAVFYLYLVRYLATTITLAVLFATLLVISPALMGVAMAIALLYAASVKLISGRISLKSGEQQADATRLQSQLAIEGLAGSRYLRVLSAAPRWEAEFESAAATAQGAMARAGFWNTVPSRAIEFLIIVVFLGVALYALNAGEAVLAMLPTLVVYFLGLVRVLPSLAILGGGRMQMVQSLPALRRYLELAHSIPQERPGVGERNVPDLARTPIELTDVTVRYGENRALDRLSLAIEPGRINVIVGASGHGKSTLVDVILRVADFAPGTVTAAGRSILDYELVAWRSQLAYAGQDPFLFHASILENIRLGRPEASDAEVMQAARVARVDAFVAELPQGWNTVVADRGQSLSGGQRQRIALARALISRAGLLLLDEPTSALDAESAAQVLEGILQARGGRTVVLVTHSERVLRHADRILVLDEGRLTYAGGYAEFQRAGGYYQRLFAPDHAAN